MNSLNLKTRIFGRLTCGTLLRYNLDPVINFQALVALEIHRMIKVCDVLGTFGYLYFTLLAINIIDVGFFNLIYRNQDG